MKDREAWHSAVHGLSKRWIQMLKFQNHGHLMQKADSLEKTDAGNDWSQEEKETIEDERWLEVITKLKDMGLSKLWEMLKDREAWGASVHGFAKSWMQFIDRTATKLL